jgi:2-dehydro-3-deoxyphosphogluconate aldolase/(4S)-4-hydroxy-2-oxoglutarate aldolase
MAPDAFVRVLGRHRTTAIVRTDDARLAADAMEAALAGGVRIVEFTLTTPGALELVAEFSERTLPEVDGIERTIVGAGTVLRTDEVERAAQAGASFVVSPVLDVEIVRAAIAANVAVLPGVHTPTEMLAAWRAGAPLCKLFPAPAGGPEWLRSVLAPLPWLKVVPTNGVVLENARAWLDAGAWALGLTGDVFRREWLASRDVGAIAARVRAIRDTVVAARTAGRSAMRDEVQEPPRF